MEHVCLLTDSPEPSGVWSHMTTLAAEFRDRRRISLVVPVNGTNTKFALQARALGLDVSAYESDVIALEGWLRGASVEVLHVHAGVAWEGHDAVLAGRRAGIPVVVRTEHLPQLITTNDQRGGHRALVRQLDRLICVSGDIGHFEFEAQRRADDLADGEWVEMGGKGALDCANPPASLALLFIGAR